jgi:tRNA (mo5U34)-methyltransferase
VGERAEADRTAEREHADAVERLRARLPGIDWYHTQELAPDLVTPGMFDLRPYVGRYGIPDDLAGRRCLDVGTFEGFWAFELERRGAEVVALDVDRIHELDWPPRLRPARDGERGEGFRLARDALGSSVRRVGMSVYEATPEALGGRFDLVFCGSVLIHLRDPMLALERMASLCTGRLVLAEEYSRKLSLVPLHAAEFRADGPWSVWWIPAARTWLRMVATAGFDDVRAHGRFRMRFRDRRGAVPHVVIHARAPAGG